MPQKDYLGKDQRRTKDEVKEEEKEIKGTKLALSFTWIKSL